jgi:hypothetical protein
MANFSFTKHDASEPTNLSTIDEEMCKDLKTEVDPDRNCALYNWVVEIGFAILSYGGSSVNEVAYLKWRKLSEKLFEDAKMAEIETLLKKYLYGKYKFTAWR